MNTDFKRVGGKFSSRGISALSPDRMPQGKYPFLQNVRPFQEGQLQPRPAAKTTVNGTPLSAYIHTLRLLNDPLPDAGTPTALIAGAGANIYTVVSGAVTEVDTGYSGYAISNVPWRPSGSAEAWLYLSDGQRSRKVNTSGTVYRIGIAAPNLPPTAVIGAPKVNVIERFNSTAGWTNTGQ